jgi:hypothetical protein
VSKWFTTLPSRLLQEQPMVVGCWRDYGTSTLEQDEHGDLRGLGCRRVIPYVRGRESCIAVCVCTV